MVPRSIARGPRPAVAGRPVPERVQMVGYQIGLMLVISLMVFALYNDFSRLI